MHAPALPRRVGNSGQAGHWQKPTVSPATVCSFRHVSYQPVQHLWQSRFQIQPIPNNMTRFTLFLYFVIDTLQAMMLGF